MRALRAARPDPLVSAEPFSYRGHELDTATGTLTCRYSLGPRSFVERVELGKGDWDTPAAAEAARLAYLLTGVSYYKTAAPPVVDVDVALRSAERALLEDFYRKGLGEFAFRNRLDLAALEIRAAVSAAPPVAPTRPTGRPLVPFGGGIDSIVAVEEVRRGHPGASLFVVSPPDAPFAAIERVVPVTGLPVVRATRHLDPQLLEPESVTGFLQGHVPITGVITALAVLAAAGTGHDTVVMSNEWSASAGNLVVDGTTVNHQYSKSREFETAFAHALGAALGERPRAFSLLRPYTELWVAERFARFPEYHPHFHSCNRAFTTDPARRLERWCGECDKCCFIDLVLAPFLARTELESIFDGREPLARPQLAERFAVLVGLTPDPKPFECVGEVGECAAAAVLAAARTDRAGTEILQRLSSQLPPVGPADTAGLLAPHRPHDIPQDFAPQDLLV